MKRALDLCCCAGGATRGLQLAGYHVTGVDIKPQKHYIGDRFIQADAMEVDLRGYDLIWASPPCQAHSDLQKQSKIIYADLIEPVRQMLITTGVPYIIENVEGAPLIKPIMLCGTMFEGLRVIRHRLFESNIPLRTPEHSRHPLVFTHDKRKAHYGKLNQDTSFVQVTGGGNCSVQNKRAAMGIQWMSGKELNEAIPPAYSRFLAEQIDLWR